MEWELGLGSCSDPRPLTFPMFPLLYESSRFINTLWIRITFSVRAAASSSSAMVGASLVAKEKASLWLPRRRGRGLGIAGQRPALQGRGLGRWVGCSRGGGGATGFPCPLGSVPPWEPGWRAGACSLLCLALCVQPGPHSALLHAVCPRARRVLCSFSSLSCGNSGNTSRSPFAREA